MSTCDQRIPEVGSGQTIEFVASPFLDLADALEDLSAYDVTLHYRTPNGVLGSGTGFGTASGELRYTSASDAFTTEGIWTWRLVGVSGNEQRQSSWEQFRMLALLPE